MNNKSKAERDVRMQATWLAELKSLRVDYPDDPVLIDCLDRLNPAVYLLYSIKSFVGRGARA